MPCNKQPQSHKLLCRWAVLPIQPGSVMPLQSAEVWVAAEPWLAIRASLRPPTGRTTPYSLALNSFHIPLPAWLLKAPASKTVIWPKPGGC